MGLSCGHELDEKIGTLYIENGPIYLDQENETNSELYCERGGNLKNIGCHLVKS